MLSFPRLICCSFFLLSIGILANVVPKLKLPLEEEQKEIDSWAGNWFPKKPYSHKPTTTTTTTVKPHKQLAEEEQKKIGSWAGNWFPKKPYSQEPTTTTTTVKPHKQLAADAAKKCDDGVHMIGVDFDPEDKRHSYNYLCLAGNRSLYAPNLNRSALQVEHTVPPAYVPPVKCMNETIHYDDALPTYGSFRLQAPKYGIYSYLPPQRWLHSLAEGAIVLLYHPCAFPGQVTALQNLVKGCLYRHIISPSQALSPERPLALLAWGKCLQMSVVDDKLAVDFIKQNAKHGLILGSGKQHAKQTRAYEAGLSLEAHLVTDFDDVELCGYMEM